MSELCAYINICSKIELARCSWDADVTHIENKGQKPIFFLYRYDGDGCALYPDHGQDNWLVRFEAVSRISRGWQNGGS